jgi:hypothetical protein
MSAYDVPSERGHLRGRHHGAIVRRKVTTIQITQLAIIS